MCQESIEELAERSKIDLNNDGVLSFDEYTKVILVIASSHEISSTYGTCEQLFSEIYMDRNQSINFIEFLLASIYHKT